jgi:hypothetical protein
MSFEAEQISRQAPRASAAATVYAIAVFLALFAIAAALWLSFGGEVFAQMGAAVWAYCF